MGSSGNPKSAFHSASRNYQLLNTMSSHPLCEEARTESMQVVLIRYGELFLKSEPVKRHFIKILLRNLAKALDSKGLSHRFDVYRGRILVYGQDIPAIAENARRVFGVVDVSVSEKTGIDLDEMADAACSLARNSLKPGMSFAIRAKRQGVEGMTSQELGAEIGAAVIGTVPGVCVDLTNPQYEIFVERRDFGGFVYDSRLTAPGGLPWGTQGKVLSLLSAGIDSPVASWLMMKRGCEVAHLHVDGGSFAGRDVFDAALRHHCTLSTWIPGFLQDLWVLDAEYFYEALTSRVKPRYRCVLCKRFMIRVGTAIVREKGMAALLTGDNLGQVASQTLANLVTVSEAANVMILRPLIAYDKEEAVSIARKIGTFEQKQGDLGCNAVPKMPATSAALEEIRKCEEKLCMDSLVKEAVFHLHSYAALNGELVEP